MKIHLLQIPRLNDWYSWGLKEIQNLLVKLEQDVEVIDINHQLYKNFYKTKHWSEIEKFGILGKGKLPMVNIISLLEKCLATVKPGDIVLTCVFTVESRSWFNIIHSMLRLKLGQKVILGSGGNGTRDPGEKAFESEWADSILQDGLCDIVFLGQAIDTITAWVSENYIGRGKKYYQDRSFPKIGFIPPKLLRYDDATFANDESYIPQDKHGQLKHRKDQKARFDTKVVIHFTQGCVKKCSFCDVWKITPQFVMRDPKEVLQEIDYYHKNMKIEKIQFADNMINASDSSFIKFLDMFYDWKVKNNQETLTWGSQLGVKPIRQQTETMFELIAATKGHLITGFDHASDSVLTHMNKLYKWEDIEHFIAKSHEHNITIGTALWLVGYPTETEHDFNEYHKLITLNKSPNSIHSHMVIPVGINKGSPLEEIVTTTSEPNEWYNEHINKNTRTRRKEYLDNALLDGDANINYKNIVEIRAHR